jgi:glycosyltransferase involved in cell wall biosynthesis
VNCQTGAEDAPTPVLLVEAHIGQGGPPTTMRDLAPTLSRRRETLVAIPPGLIGQQLAAVHSAVPTITLPWTGNRRRDRVISAPVLTRALRRLGRTAIVHANGKSALNLIAPVLRLARWRPEVFVHFHDSELSEREADRLRLWERLGVRLVVAPVSEQSAALLRGHRLAHLIGDLLPNPIATPSTCSRPPPGTRRSRQFRAATVVSRTPRKGLDVVLATARALAGRDIVFDVFGVDERSPPNEYLVECLERRRQWGLEEIVRFQGRVPNLQDHLVGYDCLLVTSRRESFCRVALEGMAAGVPVAAPRIDGLLEAVGDGNCLLYEVGDGHKAATAVASLMDGAVLPRRYRERGARWVRRYSPEAVCDHLETLYREHGLTQPVAIASHRTGVWSGQS